MKAPDRCQMTLLSCPFLSTLNKFHCIIVSFLFNLNKDLFPGKVNIAGSTCPDVFCKRGILRNFTKFTGKHLYQSLFLNKVAGLRPATLLKKRLWHRCFPVNFVDF